MSKLIYRYMSYAEFQDILTFNRLTLKYPGHWPDKLESLFLKCFESEVELEKLRIIYKRYHPDYKESDLSSDLRIMASLLIRTRCQCWTYKEDDLVMWNERVSNESVRLRVESNSFEKYQEQEHGKLVHDDVDYKAEVTKEIILDDFESFDRVIRRFVLIKKQVFKYEDEHRLVLLPERYECPVIESSSSLIEQLQRSFYAMLSRDGLADKSIKFEVRDILGVKVNPNARKEFTKIVEQDCKRYGIEFDGVSCILD